MEVRLLFVDGCPNWQVTDRRLREALALVDPDVAPVHVEVESAEDAERLRFRGSPTVLVDGADPFADEAAPVGLSCRVFQTPDGLRGAPTVGQLVEALGRSGQHGTSSDRFRSGPSGDHRRPATPPGPPGTGSTSLPPASTRRPASDG
jgi:hypothetical protein